MTDTIKWGRPLSGKECLSLELPGETPVRRHDIKTKAKVLDFRTPRTPYHLPADHPGYTILDHNAKAASIAPMKPWWGRDEAPGDYDGQCMLRSGYVFEESNAAFLRWTRKDSSDDIIAYRPRTEPAAEPDTVTIKRMTEAEAVCEWNMHGTGSRTSWLDTCRHFGIIRPEPTALERFKAAHGDLTGDEAIEAALAFGRDQ